MTISRQHARALARRNSYWTIDARGRGRPSTSTQSCKRENAPGRERVSVKAIAAKAPRKRKGRKLSAGIDFAPKWEGNKGRSLNSVRNLTRRLTGQDREAREAAE